MQLPPPPPSPTPLPPLHTHKHHRRLGVVRDLLQQLQLVLGLGASDASRGRGGEDLPLQGQSTQQGWGQGLSRG